MTIQGEGPLAGAPCFFVRLGGCDSSCAWCDTPHAVLASSVRQLPRLDADQIRDSVHALTHQYNLPPSWLILTGGNPALHDLTELVMTMQGIGWKVQVETQGTRWQPWLRLTNMVVVSPKPPSARQGDTMPALGNFLAAALEAMPYARLYLKVVVFEEEDLQYAKAVHTKYPKLPFYLSVGNVPAEAVGGGEAIARLGGTDTATTRSARYRWLAECVARDPAFGDARALPQLHVLAWGNERGR